MIDEKREALSILGSNLTLKDKKLSVTNNIYVEAIAKGLSEAREINPAFEPKNCEADKDKTEVFASVCPTLLEWRGAFRTFDWISIYPNAEYHLNTINSLIALAR